MKEKEKNILIKRLFYLFFFIFMLTIQSNANQKKHEKETNPLLEKETIENITNTKKDYLDYYKTKKYSEPPTVNKNKETKKKDFDFDIGVGVDKNKKEVNELKLDLGKKF